MHRSQNQHETNHETNHETKKMLLASEDAHHCALLVMGSGFTAGAACVFQVCWHLHHRLASEFANIATRSQVSGISFLARSSIGWDNTNYYRNLKISHITSCHNCQLEFFAEVQLCFLFTQSWSGPSKLVSLASSGRKESEASEVTRDSSWFCGRSFGILFRHGDGQPIVAIVQKGLKSSKLSKHIKPFWRYFWTLFDRGFEVKGKTGLGPANKENTTSSIYHRTVWTIVVRCAWFGSMLTLQLWLSASSTDWGTENVVGNPRFFWSKVHSAIYDQTIRWKDS